uniref:Rho-GAP domain-containing protein n=1 Tax=Cyanistes caeruleus TaxID=156563 RepID=A0A8C0VBT6_CYACU
RGAGVAGVCPWAVQPEPAVRGFGSPGRVQLFMTGKGGHSLQPLAEPCQGWSWWGWIELTLVWRGLFRLKLTVVFILPLSSISKLREDFDQGLDVFLDEHQSVHDVAALLKEFLRDMPDSLIPRELYGAFLSTASEHLWGRDILGHPTPQHPQPTGSFCASLQIPGNKMTVSNLATVFGPNILQKEKPGEKDAGGLNFEDSAAIIVVLQRLIEHHHSLFMVRGLLRAAPPHPPSL